MAKDTAAGVTTKVKALAIFIDPRLATLAVQVRLDAFTRVKKAIDDMIAQLLKEKENETKHTEL